jgi:signal transduction histidine kinase
VLFQPLRGWLQRAVNRLIYGERDTPYAALTRLGRQLEGTLAPETLLTTITATIQSTLRLPSVTIALHDRASAAPTPGERAFPLSYGGETLGELRVAPRPGEAALSPADVRLLDDLARQAGVAVHAARTTAALQRAREQLVTAREEERRRLRRDLHDGLGPALASQALTIDTACLLLEREPHTAAALLCEVKAQAQAAIAEIRRVAYGLRPPALDDLGLLGALREHAGRYIESGLAVEVAAAEPLPPLPAAVEAAAYLIVLEALTNVARHAQARHCAIALAVGDSLTLTIRDDGVGMPPTRNAGVGLSSMCERAEELGGALEITTAVGGGTTIQARLPLG